MKLVNCGANESMSERGVSAGMLDLQFARWTRRWETAALVTDVQADLVFKRMRMQGFHATLHARVSALLGVGPLPLGSVPGVMLIQELGASFGLTLWPVLWAGFDMRFVLEVGTTRARRLSRARSSSGPTRPRCCAVRVGLRWTCTLPPTLPLRGCVRARRARTATSSRRTTSATSAPSRRLAASP